MDMDMGIISPNEQEHMDPHGPNNDLSIHELLIMNHT